MRQNPQTDLTEYSLTAYRTKIIPLLEPLTLMLSDLNYCIEVEKLLSHLVEQQFEPFLDTCMRISNFTSSEIIQSLKIDHAYYCALLYAVKQSLAYHTSKHLYFTTLDKHTLFNAVITDETRITIYQHRLAIAQANISYYNKLESLEIQLRADIYQLAHIALSRERARIYRIQKRREPISPQPALIALIAPLEEILNALYKQIKKTLSTLPSYLSEQLSIATFAKQLIEMELISQKAHQNYSESILPIACFHDHYWFPTRVLSGQEKRILLNYLDYHDSEALALYFRKRSTAQIMLLSEIVIEALWEDDTFFPAQAIFQKWPVIYEEILQKTVTSLLSKQSDHTAAYLAPTHTNRYNMPFKIIVADVMGATADHVGKYFGTALLLLSSRYKVLLEKALFKVDKHGFNALFVAAYWAAQRIHPDTYDRYTDFLRACYTCFPKQFFHEITQIDGGGCTSLFLALNVHKMPQHYELPHHYRDENEQIADLLNVLARECTQALFEKLIQQSDKTGMNILMCLACRSDGYLLFISILQQLTKLCSPEVLESLLNQCDQKNKTAFNYACETYPHESLLQIMHTGWQALHSLTHEFKQATTVAARMLAKESFIQARDQYRDALGNIADHASLLFCAQLLMASQNHEEEEAYHFLMTAKKILLQIPASLKMVLFHQVEARYFLAKKSYIYRTLENAAGRLFRINQSLNAMPPTVFRFDLAAAFNALKNSGDEAAFTQALLSFERSFFIPVHIDEIDLHHQFLAAFLSVTAPLAISELTVTAQTPFPVWRRKAEFVPEIITLYAALSSEERKQYLKTYQETVYRSLLDNIVTYPSEEVLSFILQLRTPYIEYFKAEMMHLLKEDVSLKFTEIMRRAQLTDQVFQIIEICCEILKTQFNEILEYAGASIWEPLLHETLFQSIIKFLFQKHPDILSTLISLKDAQDRVLLAQFPFPLMKLIAEKCPRYFFNTCTLRNHRGENLLYSAMKEPNFESILLLFLEQNGSTKKKVLIEMEMLSVVACQTQQMLHPLVPLLKSSYEKLLQLNAFESFSKILQASEDFLDELESQPAIVSLCLPYMKQRLYRQLILLLADHCSARENNSVPAITLSEIQRLLELVKACTEEKVTATERNGMAKLLLRLKREVIYLTLKEKLSSTREVGSFGEVFLSRISQVSREALLAQDMQTLLSYWRSPSPLISRRNRQHEKSCVDTVERLIQTLDLSPDLPTVSAAQLPFFSKIPSDTNIQYPQQPQGFIHKPSR